VLQIAQRMAGYSLGEADLLRRAMGKKKPEVMQEQRQRFVEGCVANGIQTSEAGRVFDLILEFAGYGFPKAHSAAYAYVTYQTAYLKANHPVEFMAAVLTIESANHDKLARYIAHVREKGIEILPPDVNESGRFFRVADGKIRFGFSGIKGVGEGAIEALLDARRAEETEGGGGAFKSLFDFCDRVSARKVNRRVMEFLIKCGAYDSLHPNRAAVWATLDTALERAASAQRDREVGQESLFGGLGDEGGEAEPPLLEVPLWTERERLGHEKELLGFYVTGHPLGAVAEDLARFTDTTATQIEGKEGREVRVGGLLTMLRETRTRRGKRMGFGTLEDLEGSFELVIFTQSYEEHLELLRLAKDGGEEGNGPIPLVVSGNLEAGESPKILVRSIGRLADAEKTLTSKLRLRVKEPEVTRDRLLALRKVLGQHPGDCTVHIHITIPGESETIVSVGAVRGVRPTDALLSEVNALFGRPVSERCI